MRRRIPRRREAHELLTRARRVLQSSGVVLGLTISPPLHQRPWRPRPEGRGAVVALQRVELGREEEMVSFSRFSLFFSFLCWDLSLVSFTSTRLSCLGCIIEIAEGWYLYSNQHSPGPWQLCRCQVLHRISRILLRTSLMNTSAYGVPLSWGPMEWLLHYISSDAVVVL